MGTHLQACSALIQYSNVGWESTDARTAPFWETVAFESMLVCAMSLYHPAVFSFPHALGFWGSLSWLYAMETRQLKRTQKNAAALQGPDRYSGLVITIVSAVIQLLGLGLAFVPAWHVEPQWVSPLFVLGIVILMAGVLLRMHCWRVLGRFFTHTVTIANDHQLVQEGAYRWLRHPSYFGALLTYIGMGLALGSYASLAVLVVGCLACYAYRMHVEEAALEQALGASYASYKLGRKRIIPFIY